MFIVENFISVVKRCMDFSGRSRRSEFWYFVLVVAIIGGVIGGVFGIGGIYLFYLLIVVLLSLSVQVRRLHDINKSGWWYFVSFIPFIGGLVLLFFNCLEGTRGPNKYGPDPKGR